jgi:hypothetical protein
MIIDRAVGQHLEQLGLVLAQAVQQVGGQQPAGGAVVEHAPADTEHDPVETEVGQQRGGAQPGHRHVEEGVDGLEHLSLSLSGVLSFCFYGPP